MMIESRTASPPFDDSSTSDVVIRTSDGVDFYVHKLILSLASPFFKQLFTLHQPSESFVINAASPPVIDVSEKSHVIDGVLRLCYPVQQPDMSTVSSVVDTLAAATKYDISIAISRLKAPLSKLLSTLPLEVYALACQYRLEDVAVDAAEAWEGVAISAQGQEDKLSIQWKLTPAGESYVPEMAEIPSGMYARLVNYVRSGIAPPSFCTPPRFPPPPPTPSFHPLVEFVVTRSHFPLSTDIAVYSIDAVQFSAHRAILSSASEVMRDILSRDQTLDRLDLAENGDTLAIVFRSCYPGGINLANGIPVSLTASVLSAARKYKLPVLEGAAKRRLQEMVQSDPLDVFFHTAMVGWKEGARDAAVRLSRLPIYDLYTSTMETTSAKYYHALLKFRFDYRRAVAKCIHYCESFSDQILGDELWGDWMDCDGVHSEVILAAAFASAQSVRDMETTYEAYYSNPMISSEVLPEHCLQDIKEIKASLLVSLSQVSVK